MNYRINKKDYDLRTNTCGYFIPDGYFRVVSMSFETQDQLLNIKKFGYQISETDQYEGLYEDATGKLVDQESVEEIAYYGKGEVKYTTPKKTEPNEKPSKVISTPDPIDPEIARLRELCDAKGIKYSPLAKAPNLKNKINEHQAAKRGKLSDNG